jgi:hypothetical protein
MRLLLPVEPTLSHVAVNERLLLRKTATKEHVEQLLFKEN